MLDKGTEENIVKELLQPDKKDNKDYILQWFCMLTAIGAGIFLVSWVRPFWITFSRDPGIQSGSGIWSILIIFQGKQTKYNNPSSS